MGKNRGFKSMLMFGLAMTGISYASFMIYLLYHDMKKNQFKSTYDKKLECQSKNLTEYQLMEDISQFCDNIRKKLRPKIIIEKTIKY